MRPHASGASSWSRRSAQPRFKLLYDIYHMQIMEGDVIRTIKDNNEYIAHYHTGGNPGRNEIDETQELNYTTICKAIIEKGFTRLPRPGVHSQARPDDFVGAGVSDLRRVTQLSDIANSILTTRALSTSRRRSSALSMFFRQFSHLHWLPFSLLLLLLLPSHGDALKPRSRGTRKDLWKQRFRLERKILLPKIVAQDTVTD